LCRNDRLHNIGHKPMNKKCTVLIIEDDNDDAFFLEQALIKSSFGGNIEHLKDGRELLDRLLLIKQQEQDFPELLVLDLNMPFKSGLDVLSEMNNDAELKNIPVAVVTSSLRNHDKIKCEQLGCDLYINKPVRFSGYYQIAGDLLTLLRSRFHYC
jgi:DNA-binding response OmpR family regulator